MSPSTSCRDCIVACIERAEDLGQRPVCPACNQGPLSVGQLREAVRSKNRFGADKLSLRKVDFQTSTKLKALVKKLELLKEQDPRFKALVFSQVRPRLVFLAGDKTSDIVFSLSLPLCSHSSNRYSPTMHSATCKFTASTSIALLTV